MATSKAVWVAQPADSLLKPGDLAITNSPYAGTNAQLTSPRYLGKNRVVYLVEASRDGLECWLVREFPLGAVEYYVATVFLFPYWSPDADAER